MGFQAPAPIHEASEKQQIPPLWNVVLLNDDDHTYDYVIEMLTKLFLKTADEAYQHAVEVDSVGRTIIMTCEQGAAEYAKDQIHAFGADWRLSRSKGSMSAIIEPASPGVLN